MPSTKAADYAEKIPKLVSALSDLLKDPDLVFIPLPGSLPPAADQALNLLLDDLAREHIVIEEFASNLLRMNVKTANIEALELQVAAFRERLMSFWERLVRTREEHSLDKHFMAGAMAELALLESWVGGPADIVEAIGKLNGGDDGKGKSESESSDSRNSSLPSQ